LAFAGNPTKTLGETRKLNHLRNGVAGSPIVSPFFRADRKSEMLKAERGPRGSLPARSGVSSGQRRTHSEVLARHKSGFALDQEQARFQFILEVFNPFMQFVRLREERYPMQRSFLQVRQGFLFRA
jgi:hypothetical protein